MSILILPVGWGYMQLHSVGSSLLIIDGGSLPPCLRGSARIAASYINFLSKNMREWVWLLSHVDYDHYSIITLMINQGLLSLPKTIILPGIYSEDACREVIRNLYVAFIVVAKLLKVPIPKVFDLYKLFKRINSEGILKVGALQGSKLSLGSSVYYVLWPPPLLPLKVCRDIREAIDDKLRELCRRKGEDCWRILENTLDEYADLPEVLKPDRVVENDFVF